MKKSLPQMLSEEIGLSPYQFQRLAKRAPDTYKHYVIEKRNGGDRWIAQPAVETKHIQRWLINNVLSSLPVHQAAMAYKVGSSIALNAELHSKNSYLAKFDFTNFFNSIKYHNIVNFFTENFGEIFDKLDIANMARIVCVREVGAGLCLSIGAPSSPLLSNAILYNFDEQVNEWCQKRMMVYTRYADDLTFSTNVKGACADIDQFLKSILSDLDNPALRLNEKKTVHSSKKFRRQITGLVINNEGSVSLGRERKRNISASIHKFKTGILEGNDLFKLQGLLGFASDVDPKFIVSMNQKYGNDTLAKIYIIRKPEI
jgi:RNA-directed DNA polymerase